MLNIRGKGEVGEYSNVFVFDGFDGGNKMVMCSICRYIFPKVEYSLVANQKVF